MAKDLLVHRMFLESPEFHQLGVFILNIQSSKTLCNIRVLLYFYVFVYFTKCLYTSSCCDAAFNVKDVLLFPSQNTEYQTNG